MVADASIMAPDTTFSPSPLKRTVIALLSGAIAPLAFSPNHMWLLGFLSVLGLYVALKHVPPRLGACIGWCYGLGFFGAGVSWVYVSINVYGNAGPIFAGFLTGTFVALLALFFALQCWLTQRYFNRSFYLLSFAVLWVFGEWFRGWLLTGFPWLYMGYPHVTSPFAGLAPITGVLGISFVVVFSGAAMGEMTLVWCRSRSLVTTARTYLPTVLFFLWVLSSLSSRLQWVEPVDGATLDVALVQGNIDQRRKFDLSFIRENLDSYDALSAPHWDADLVIWPETAIPYVYEPALQVVDVFDRTARANNATLVTGIFGETENGLHNSITSLGNGSGIYHKQKLVPFGEYTPLAGLLASLLQLFDLPMSSLSRGPAQQDLLSAGDYRFAPFICYEVVYPDFVSRSAEGADFLVTISNDTWFGASWGPLQHLEMAAMRALENGRYLVRATNNGVTAIIDERGNVIAQAPQFQAAVLRGQIQVFTDRTPFSIWGSWPLLLISLLILIAVHRCPDFLLFCLGRMRNP